MEKKRDFLSLFDASEAELATLLRRAEELRFLRNRREPHATRPGRMLALIFEKASTRTRAAPFRASSRVSATTTATKASTPRSRCRMPA